MELIIINENHELQYFQKSQIVINKKQKKLVLFPIKDGIDFVEIKFGERCYQKINILCINPSNDETKKYILIFPNEIVCKKVYNIFNNNQVANIDYGQNMFQTKVLAPIIAEVENNALVHPRFSKIIIDFLNHLLDETEKQSFLNFIKGSKMETIYLASIPPTHETHSINVNIDQGNENIISNSPTSETSMLLNLTITDANNPSDSSNNEDVSSTDAAPINAPSNNESLATTPIENFKEQASSSSIIAEAVERRLSLRKRPNSRESCLAVEEMEDANDGDYNPEDYKENEPPIKKQRRQQRNSLKPTTKTIKTPKPWLTFKKPLPANIYEVISFDAVNGEQQKSKLLVFTCENKKFCYEYIWAKWENCSGTYFICNECNSMAEKKFVAANQGLDKNGFPCIRINTMEHICEPKEYIPEKFDDDLKIYLPNYELSQFTRRGITSDYLYLYTSEEKDYYYEFRFDETMQKAFCVNCQTQKHWIPATICIDENGNEYASIRNLEHVCEPILYIPSAKIETVQFIQLSNFKVYEKMENGKPVQKLSHFCDETKETFYEYTKVSEDIPAFKNVYECLKCWKSKKRLMIRARIISIGNGTCLSGNFDKHICKPESKSNIVETKDIPNNSSNINECINNSDESIPNTRRLSLRKKSLIYGTYSSLDKDLENSDDNDYNILNELEDDDNGNGGEEESYNSDSSSDIESLNKDEDYTVSDDSD